MIPLILFLLAIAVGGCQLLFSSKTVNRKNVIEIYLKTVIFFCLGVMGIFGFIAHTFFAEETAAMIGWWSGSPFQFEVGMANLGFGLIGLLSPFFREQFWAATILGNLAWYWGNAVGHIRSMMYQHNFTSGNAGAYFYADIFFPLIPLLLLGMHFYLKSKKRA